VLVWPAGRTRHAKGVVKDAVKELKCVKALSWTISSEDGVAWLMCMPAYTEPVDTAAVKLL